MDCVLKDGMRSVFMWFRMHCESLSRSAAVLSSSIALSPLYVFHSLEISSIAFKNKIQKEMAFVVLFDPFFTVKKKNSLLNLAEATCVFRIGANNDGLPLCIGTAGLGLTSLCQGAIVSGRKYKAGIGSPRLVFRMKEIAS
jgi:hypothetical protein